MDLYSSVIQSRFWDKVSKTDECWLWTGAVTQTGYGKFAIKRPDGTIKNFRAHKYAWLIERGEVPPGKELCHKCDNRLCVRPQHLFPGTHTENMQDASQKGRLYTAPPRPKLPRRGPDVIELEDDAFDEAGSPDSGRGDGWDWEDIFDQLFD